MILSAQTIRKRNGMISPFYEQTIYGGLTFGLSSAGYDIRIAETIFIKSGYTTLASSMEKFDIPNDILARVTDKSTWARKGIAVQNTVIEPGWRGFLTLELTFNPLIDSQYSLDIKAGTPIAQIIFEQLDYQTDKPYNGKYQDQSSGSQSAKF